MQERPKRSPTGLQSLPMVPLRDIVVFPHTMVPFVVGRKSSLLAVEKALAGDKTLFLSTQRNAKIDNPGPDEVNTVGTTAAIVQHLKLPNGNVLITESDRGHAIEVTPQGKRVWEYWNPDVTPDPNPSRAAMYRFTRYPTDYLDPEQTRRATAGAKR